MRIFSLTTALLALSSSAALAADFEFYGRSGDAIELNFGALPGTPAGATFGSITAGSLLSTHTTLTSSQLGQGSFASDGRLWVFADAGRTGRRSGDTNPNARGFQGRLEGTIDINGQSKTFAVNVVEGYTGAGSGSVLQSGERFNREANNPLHVAMQQQRLNYLGFRNEGSGARPSVTGVFDTATDSALKTFQAAIISGSNVNATQAGVNGIIGPNTAGWLNAANAPTWDELIDPDPQAPGSFSVANMIGDFDILPARDSGSGQRTGLTPQTERFGTSWTIDVFKAGSALAKSRTGSTQLMNGMSMLDGYGSAAIHNTHRAGMDFDMHVDYPTWVAGNGVISAAEQGVIDAAVAFIDAGLAGDPGRGRIVRYITSNYDIGNGIQAARPGTSIYIDNGGGHSSHLHVDVAPPARIGGVANLAGDFNLDGRVDIADYTVWRDGYETVRTIFDYGDWWDNFGAVATTGNSAQAIPEPSAVFMVLAGSLALVHRSRSH